jgi:hypothetical protein
MQQLSMSHLKVTVTLIAVVKLVPSQYNVDTWLLNMLAELAHGRHLNADEITYVVVKLWPLQTIQSYLTLMWLSMLHETPFELFCNKNLPTNNPVDQVHIRCLKTKKTTQQGRNSVTNIIKII